MYYRGIEMNTQVTIRIPQELKNTVALLCKKLRRNRSEVIRMALERFAEDIQDQDTDYPYRKVQDLIGSITSGVPDLGTNHRKHLMNRIRRA
jgi:Arc/MetJ-type ribon-helix-helix transcriptional regulator